MRSTLIILLLVAFTNLFAQQTIFNVMQSTAKLGDQEYARGEYRKAVEYYRASIDKDPGNVPVLSKIASCYFQLKEYRKEVEAYNEIIKSNKPLSAAENYQYAEAQSSLGNYDVAIAYYKKCLDDNKENDLVSRKIWALSNIHFLHEDSSHYSIKAMDAINTRASEMAPAIFGSSIVFTSNRKGTRPLDLASSETAGPYYELYSADSLSKQSRFAKSLGIPFNAGPVAFYDHYRKMIFVASAAKAGDDGSRPLGLYFAELKDSKWKMMSPWVHNSTRYSITDVTINEDGSRIYFSSNMKGGQGGKDLYTSVLKADQSWSTPVNLGESINTKGDEAFPYLHRNGTLYFASNGLPGIGGLDIFQSIVKPNGFGEPENIGYPINSQYDDFGLVFDTLASHGYFTSNRSHGGLDDDLYEFAMDLQTYPFQLTGVLKYKEHVSSDTANLHLWGNTEIVLVNTWDDMQVQKITTDASGNFTFTIPYFGRYHILVVDEDGHEHKASLELEKYRTESYRHEIVVVKDLFAETQQR